jgi:hypothetical protein
VCWCGAIAAGVYRIGQCVRSVAGPGLYEYTNRSCCVKKNGTGVGGPDERVRVHDTWPPASG